MNGGRLSDDEAFLIGVGELRTLLDEAAPDGGVAERALTRIAVRYPDEAEQLRQLWLEHGPAADRAPIAGLLASLEAQHRADADQE